MQLYFIRHAQSENNLLWTITGSTDGRHEDPDLTELGRKQVVELVKFLSGNGKKPRHADAYDPYNLQGFDLTHIYTSLMHRAVATGEIIAEKLGLPLHAWCEIHERGGIYTYDSNTEERVGLPGKGRKFFETRYPKLILPDELDDTGWWNQPYETEEEAITRAEQVVHDLLEWHGNTDHRVALISHGGFYNAFLLVVLNLAFQMDCDVTGQKKQIWFALNNAGITRIDFYPEHIGIIYMNRIDFLPEVLVT